MAIMQGNRYAFKLKTSVKQNLYLTLFMLNSFILIVGITAWNAFKSSEKSMNVITNDVIPVTESVSKVVSVSSKISRLVSMMMFAEEEQELEAIYNEIYCKKIQLGQFHLFLMMLSLI